MFITRPCIAGAFLKTMSVIGYMVHAFPPSALNALVDKIALLLDFKRYWNEKRGVDKGVNFAKDWS